MSGVTVNAAIAVYVVACASNAHRGSDRVAKVGLKSIREVVVESQCVTRLVLHDRTLQKIVSDTAGIEEITSSRRHEREYLFRDRIDELRRNDIQRRIGSRIDRGITLRRLKRDPLVYLINQNPSRIVKLAILIASRKCNRNQLAIEQNELLIDVRATDRGQAELGSDAGRHQTGLRSYQVVEVAGELRGIGQ